VAYHIKLHLDSSAVLATRRLRIHLNGNLTRKQNVFDDFAACARHY
jgi:hypothetical protein